MNYFGEWSQHDQGLDWTRVWSAPATWSADMLSTETLLSLPKSMETIWAQWLLILILVADNTLLHINEDKTGYYYNNLVTNPIAQSNKNTQ